MRFVIRFPRLLLGLVIFTTASLVTFDDMVGLILRNIMTGKPPSVKQNITILFWHPPGWLRKGEILHRKMREECGGCVFTNIKSAIDEAHAVVFHDSFIVGQGSFPEKRITDQKYVFWTRESPYFTKMREVEGASLKDYDSQFNLTVTHRRDSDVQILYGCWSTSHQLVKNNPGGVNKTKVAVMIASENRRLGSKLRIEYSSKLIEAGLKLERYGSCFGKRYEGDEEELLAPFKFFMSFENSIHCRDYITEKFWTKGIQMGLVPVVWGPSKSDMEHVAPPYSYIHAEDFSSAEELANYLNYLDQNDTAYKEYFRWRMATPPITEDKVACVNDFPTSKVPQGYCQLCTTLIKHPEVSIIPSITDWWYGTEPAECLAASQEQLSEENKLATLTKLMT